MAHPPFWPFSPKSNGFSVSPVLKGEKTANIRPYSAPNNTAVKQLRCQREWPPRGRAGCYAHRVIPLGGHWTKIRAEG
jgi:hypothetical protein